MALLFASYARQALSAVLLPAHIPIQGRSAVTLGHSDLYCHMGSLFHHRRHIPVLAGELLLEQVGWRA